MSKSLMLLRNSKNSSRNIKMPFLVAGFFYLRFRDGKKYSPDRFLYPSQKNLQRFTLDGGVSLQLMDTLSNKVPEKLEIKTNIDLDAIHGILEDEMKNRNITEEIKKIIAVLQTVNGKKVWNINSVLTGMDILKAHVEDDSKTVLKMEKTSFVEIMKKMPMMPMPPEMKGNMQEESEENPEQAEEEMKKLTKLEEEIEKEKVRLEGVTKKKPQKKKSKSLMLSKSQNKRLPNQNQRKQ